MAVSVQEEIKSWNDLGWKKPPRPSSPAVDVTSGQLCTLRELRHLLSPQPQSRVTISRRFVPISHPHVTTPSSASPRECGQKTTTASDKILFVLQESPSIGTLSIPRDGEPSTQGPGRTRNPKFPCSNALCGFFYPLNAHLRLPGSFSCSTSALAWQIQAWLMLENPCKHPWKVDCQDGNPAPFPHCASARSVDELLEAARRGSGH